MGNQIKKSLGQAVIELTITIGLICVVMILTARMGSQIKNKFKHDYIQPALNHPDFKLQVTSDLIFFKTSKESKNLKALKEAGWKFDQAIKDSDGSKGVMIMSKEEKIMIVTKDLGILL